MLSEAAARRAAMEGDGAYNRHARIPAGGAALALPFLEQAVLNLSVNGSAHPFVIADYGSSQGKNSLAPMRAAIRGLRVRLGANRPIKVVHVDQPGNDFNTLFGVLHSDPDRYSSEDENVFPSAIGRSFYEQVFPETYVDLGWCSYAAVWLSRVPALIPGHFVMMASTGEARAAFDRQGAEDWKRFLSLRATELRPGGRLVVVLPAMDDQGVAGIEPLFDQTNAVIAEMVAAGSLRAEERARMVLPVYARRRAQLLEPFGSAGCFEGLVVEHCELAELPDATWSEYQRHGNVQTFAAHHAAFVRAVFAPSLALALADPALRDNFANQLETRLRRRLAERLQPFHSFVQTMVLAKQDRGAKSAA
jgi:hypothetical protein